MQLTDDSTGIKRPLPCVRAHEHRCGHIWIEFSVSTGYYARRTKRSDVGTPTRGEDSCTANFRSPTYLRSHNSAGSCHGHVTLLRGSSPHALHHAHGIIVMKLLCRFGDVLTSVIRFLSKLHATGHCTCGQWGRKSSDCTQRTNRNHPYNLLLITHQWFKLIL